MTASIVQDMFLGGLDATSLMPYPFLGDEDMELLGMFRDALNRFARDHIDAAAIDGAHAIPQQVLDGLAEVGLFGMRIPEEFGGLDLNATQYCRVGIDLAVHDGATSTMSGGHSTIGIKALLIAGTDEQKQKYLPRLATGELIAAFALSEPDAGSDAQSLKCTAHIADDGKSYRLDGNKLWITNGGIADLVTVFARTPDHPREDGRPSISCFLVERSMGFVPGKEEEKLGIRGSSTVPLVFEGVTVPAENLVGEPGGGFHLALEILNAGRTGLSSACLGASRIILEETVRYTIEREQFGKSIGSFQLIQEKLGRMAQDIHALECMVFLTTGLADRLGVDLPLESALCKVFGTETLWSVVNDAVQCAGGNGFTTDYPFERMLRDARVNMIFEGTNEILRIMVASTGLREPMRRLAEDVPARSPYGRLLEGAEAPDPLPVPDALRSEALALSMSVSELAVSAGRAVREHGKAIREEQLVAAALTDQAIGAFGQAAVLSRATALHEDARGADLEAETLLAQGACRRLARLGRRAAETLRDNDHPILLKTAGLVTRLGGMPGERPSPT
jgi:acyl-CoA dehydrogenase family protein 9